LKAAASWKDKAERKYPSTKQHRAQSEIGTGELSEILVTNDESTTIAGSDAMVTVKAIEMPVL
jgi:hypothetical protein